MDYFYGISSVACWVILLDFSVEVHTLAMLTPAPNTVIVIAWLLFMFFGLGYPKARLDALIGGSE